MSRKPMTMSAADIARGDWRKRLADPPRPRTLPEMMQLALDIAAEDAYFNESERDWSARNEFEEVVGYDLFDSLRRILEGIVPIDVRPPLVDLRESLDELVREAHARLDALADEIAPPHVHHWVPDPRLADPFIVRCRGCAATGATATR